MLRRETFRAEWRNFGMGFNLVPRPKRSRCRYVYSSRRGFKPPRASNSPGNRDTKRLYLEHGRPKRRGAAISETAVNAFSERFLRSLNPTIWLFNSGQRRVRFTLRQNSSCSAPFFIRERDILLPFDGDQLHSCRLQFARSINTSDF